MTNERHSLSYFARPDIKRAMENYCSMAYGKTLAAHLEWYVEREIANVRAMAEKTFLKKEVIK